MDPKQILKNLQYRIETTPKSDPERENAIRLRDRLLARFGLSLEEITEKREARWFQKLTWLEQGIVGNYFIVTFPDAEKNPYCLGYYVKKYRTQSEKKYSVYIHLTDEEFAKAEPYITNLLEMWRREFKVFKKKLTEEMTKRERAFRYAFLDKGNLLRVVSSEEATTPNFDLADLMRAARDLEDLVFPENHLKHELKQIANG